MKKYHDITEVAVDGASLAMTVDGTRRVFELRTVSRTLAAATAAQRACYEISPSGYGIHWPQLDEDISIDGLLDIRHAPLGAKSASRSAPTVP